jgi:D-serine deaminase-like pyridoxal phosphate-dependent protein
MQEWRNRSQLMPSLDDLKRTIAREFGTPALVIDLDKVEANIRRVQAICDKAGVANRPHIKTRSWPTPASATFWSATI